MNRSISYAQALGEALAEEMERDPRVFVMGEDVGVYGGLYGVTAGLLDRFGPKRIIDTPISEMFIVGGGVGAAITGLRPVVELQSADFLFTAADEIIGKMGKWRYMHGGRLTVPMVVRMPAGALNGLGPEHSQCPESILLQAPGLYIAFPSNAHDAKGLLKTAIRDDNPVCFFEHKALYQLEGQVPSEEYTVPFGVARTLRDGSDLSVVCWGRMVHWALEAAERAELEGISAEVIDLRCLRPLDLDAILESVRKTGRLLVAHEAQLSGGAGAEIAALVSERAFDALDAPVRRVGAPDVPTPQSTYLEGLWLPNADDVFAAIRELAAGRKG